MPVKQIYGVTKVEYKTSATHIYANIQTSHETSYAHAHAPHSHTRSIPTPTFDSPVSSEGFDERLLLDIGRDVGEVKRGGRREDVGVVFASGLLESVKRGVGEVFGEAAVGGALLGHLDGRVLGGSDANRLPVEPDLIHVLRRLKGLAQR